MVIIKISIVINSKEKRQLLTGNRLLVVGSVSFLDWSGNYIGVFFIVIVKLTNTNLALFCTCM